MTADDENRPDVPAFVNEDTPAVASASHEASGREATREDDARALKASPAGWGMLGIAVLVASAVVASNLFGFRDRIFGSATPAPAPAAASRSLGALGTPAVPSLPASGIQTVLRSQPWWQGVATLQGSGPQTIQPFKIDGGADQWRVTWTCQGGQLTVAEPHQSKPLINAGCPGNGTSYATDTGTTVLTVQADGPWQLQVDQQIDVPLIEPPTPAMTAAGAVAVLMGSFYDIDQSGSGRVTIYRLADGTYALRLDNFFVTPNVDLEIRFSPIGAPHSTGQYLSVPADKVVPLDVTAGSINFTVPAGIDPTKYSSVVIWCPLINSAYAAATLTRAA